VVLWRPFQRSLADRLRYLHHGLDWISTPTTRSWKLAQPAVGMNGSDGPTVIKDDATYKMWYHGCNADYSVCSIGYATSPDGVVGPNIPAIRAGGYGGRWDETGLGWPRVIKKRCHLRNVVPQRRPSLVAPLPRMGCLDKYATNPS